MATFLRFTQNAQADIEKGYSYLKTPSMKKARKLDGLCALNFVIDLDYDTDVTEKEIIAQIKNLAMCVPYVDTSNAVLIEGSYLGQNPNGEGVIIRAERVIAEYSI